jgi:predicted TIM-barrel fold metal-dependent hydrolase
MGKFAVDDPVLRPLFEEISGLGVPVMIDVGHDRDGRGHAGRSRERAAARASRGR